MKKVVLVSFLVLLITIGFGVYYLLSNLDNIVKTAIETYGSEATQTAVRVNQVKLDLADGSGAIHGLTIGNPQGFDAGQAFSLSEIATQIDLKSLSTEATVIEHISVRAPEVFFELNDAGQNNLDKLKQNLVSNASGSSRTATAKQNGPAPKLIIRKLLFEDGSVHARVIPLNKAYDLSLPNIEMKNLGGKDGATPEQIAEHILKELIERSMAEIKKKGLDQYKKKLEGEVNKRLEEEKGKLGEKVGEKLKGVLNY